MERRRVYNSLSRHSSTSTASRVFRNPLFEVEFVSRRSRYSSPRVVSHLTPYYPVNTSRVISSERIPEHSRKGPKPPIRAIHIPLTPSFSVATFRGAPDGEPARYVAPITGDKFMQNVTFSSARKDRTAGRNSRVKLLDYRYISRQTKSYTPESRDVEADIPKRRRTEIPTIVHVKSLLKSEKGLLIPRSL